MQYAVSLRDVSLRLGQRYLWKHMELSIAPGEFVAVLGPNGAGKSSFVKMLLGQYQATSGEVTVLGGQPKYARNRIGYIPQQKAFDKDVPISGRNLVGFGINGTKWFSTLSDTQKNRISESISEVGATAYADKPLGTLSGGEQQRLRIAQAVVSSPELLLCDEPLLSLDLASQQNVSQILNNRCKKGAAIVFVTHEINPILPLVDRVLYIVGGNWTIGTPTEVLTSAHLTKLYGAPVEVLRVHGRIIVISAGDQAAAEPQSTHHHVHSEADER